MIKAVEQSKDFAEALSYWATFCGVLALSFGGIFALWKHRSDQSQQKLMQARSNYQDYIKFSIDFPEYFINYWEKKDISEIDKMKYFGFIAYTLSSMEEIIVMDPHEEWKETVRSDLRCHSQFLASAEFQRTKSCYFPPLRILIDEVVAEGVKADA